MIDPGDTAILAAIAFTGALIFGVTGFGSALVTIPLASHIVPLPFALALFAICDLAAALRVGLENPKNAVRIEYYRLVPTIVVGTALGVTLLVNLPRQARMAALGVFILLFALYTLVPQHSRNPVSSALGLARRPHRRHHQHRLRRRRPALRHLPLAPRPDQGAVPRHARLHHDDQHLAARRGLPHHRAAPRTEQVWLTALFAVPAILIGISVAQRIYLKISRDALMRAVAVMLLASGSSLIWRALALTP